MTLSTLFVILFLVSSVYLLKLSEECVDREQNNGVCTRLNDCPVARKLLKEGRLPKTCSFDTDFHPMVCCPIEKDEKLTKENKIKEIETRKTVKNISKLKCDEYSSLPLDFAHAVRIVGGTVASVGEFPHMAALGYGKYPEIEWSCGGTLISDFFIMTAAHCITTRDGKEVSYAQLGDILLHKNILPDENIYEIEQRFKHDNYETPIKYNDIAVLKLKRKVEFTSYIKPACLYNEDNFGEIKFLEATGWGVTERAGDQSDSLRKVELEIFKQSECRDIYSQVPGRLLPEGVVDSQFCAGSTKRIADACQGDSGGPVQFYNYHKTLYTVVGVTSFGKSCGIKQPGVYTKVSSFVPWIENIVWSDNSDI